MHIISRKHKTAVKREEIPSCFRVSTHFNFVKHLSSNLMIMIMIMNLYSSRTIRYSKALYIKLQLKNIPEKLMSPVYTKSRGVRVNHPLHKFDLVYWVNVKSHDVKRWPKTNTALSLSLLRALHCRSASIVPKTDFMTEQKAYPIWF